MRPFRCRVAASPCGIHLARVRAGSARALALLLMQCKYFFRVLLMYKDAKRAKAVRSIIHSCRFMEQSRYARPRGLCSRQHPRGELSSSAILPRAVASFISHILSLLK